MSCKICYELVFCSEMKEDMKRHLVISQVELFFIKNRCGRVALVLWSFVKHFDKNINIEVKLFFVVVCWFEFIFFFYRFDIMDDNSEILELKTRFEALEKINNRQKVRFIFHLPFFRRRRQRLCSHFRTILKSKSENAINFKRNWWQIVRKWSCIPDAENTVSFRMWLKNSNYNWKRWFARMRS